MVELSGCFCLHEMCQETDEHCIRHVDCVRDACEFFAFGLRPIGGGNRQLIVYFAMGDCRLQQFACAKQAVKRHPSLDALVEPMPMQGYTRQYIRYNLHCWKASGRQLMT